MNNDAAPFSNLTPEHMLDALESLGLAPDGRLLALNSFENRVYQFGLDNGPMRIVKFYRPGRWSDEAILEEHTFSNELAERQATVKNMLSGEQQSVAFEKVAELLK